MSGRVLTSAAVDWGAPAFDTVGASDETIEIAPLIREGIDRLGGPALNALTILQSHVSGATRRIQTFDHSALDTPILTLKVQGNSVTAAEPASLILVALGLIGLRLVRLRRLPL